jgi:hypothetical protein
MIVYIAKARAYIFKVIKTYQAVRVWPGGGPVEIFIVVTKCGVMISVP